jgi:hypothetical protein
MTEVITPPNLNDNFFISGILKDINKEFLVIKFSNSSERTVSLDDVKNIEVRGFQ